VVLHEQDPIVGQLPDSLRERLGLVGVMHETETIDHHIHRRAVVSLRCTPVLEQAEPGAAVWAAVLDHGAAVGQQAGGGHTRNGFLGLPHEGERLDTARLVRNGRVLSELSEPTPTTQPQPQRVGRVGPGVLGRREVIAGWLSTHV